MSNTKPRKALRATGKTGIAPGAGFCCYIGPTIPGVIQSGTVYKGDLKTVRKELTGITERFPLVKNLVVSGQTLAADRMKVKTPGNLLYEQYAKLAGNL